MAKKKHGFVAKNKMPILIVIGVIVAFAAVEIYLSTGCCAMPAASNETLAEKTAKYEKAPELQDVTGYINTPNGTTLSDLQKQGKVVLVDFWTYSCINCQRTIPYLNAWYQKYHDKGLEIVGVHTPEFEFEKNYNNVKSAVAQFGIKYPVVLDSNYGTWNAFGNQYWPRDYLIDVDGFIRHDHIGEGDYAQTEQQIQELLSERAQRLGINSNMNESMSSPTDALQVDFSKVQSPEIYLGYKFARQQIGNAEGLVADYLHNYTIPDSKSWIPNVVYVGGSWYSSPDFLELMHGGGNVGLYYSARNVNIVAGGNGTVIVLVDGKTIPASDSGPDLKDSMVKVSDSRLYNLVLSKDYGAHYLELLVSGDVKLYTFTFG